MSLDTTLSAIKAIWPILVVFATYEIGVLVWRILVWRSLVAILESGNRLERIVLNHRHEPKTGGVVVVAAGVSGQWGPGFAPPPPANGGG